MSNSMRLSEYSVPLNYTFHSEMKETQQYRIFREHLKLRFSLGEDTLESNIEILY